MKLRSPIIAALIVATVFAAAVFAQGQRGFAGRRGGGANPNAASVQTTPAQQVSRRLQMVAAFLSLDPAQTSALTDNTALVGLLTNDETSLQSNAAALKIAYSALAAQLIAVPSTPPDLTAIENLMTSDLQLRATAASRIVRRSRISAPPCRPSKWQLCPV